MPDEVHFPPSATRGDIGDDTDHKCTADAGSALRKVSLGERLAALALLLTLLPRQRP